MASIGVRGIISADGGPLKTIIGCGRSYGRRKRLVSLAHFEPVLLAGVLGSWEFSYEAARLGGDDLHGTFRRRS